MAIINVLRLPYDVTNHKVTGSRQQLYSVLYTAWIFEYYETCFKCKGVFKTALTLQNIRKKEVGCLKI